MTSSEAFFGGRKTRHRILELLVNAQGKHPWMDQIEKSVGPRLYVRI